MNPQVKKCRERAKAQRLEAEKTGVPCAFDRATMLVLPAKDARLEAVQAEADRMIAEARERRAKGEPVPGSKGYDRRGTAAWVGR